MRYKVKVTENDIETGICGDNQLCPIALALGPLNLTRLIVEDDRIEFYSDPDSPIKKVIKLPKKARDFIHYFDDSGYGQPFSFTLCGM